MSIRGTVRFYNEGNFLGAVYNRHDSQVNGLGEKIAKFIESHPVGYDAKGENYKTPGYCNGPEELLVNFICHLRKESQHGQIYMSIENLTEMYDYKVIYEKSGDILPRIILRRFDEELFAGSFEEYKSFLIYTDD